MASEIEKLKLKLIEWTISQDKAEDLQWIGNQIEKLENARIDSTKLVGHRSNGLRVLKEQLVESLQEAMRQYESGKVTALDDLESESEQW